LTHRNRRASQDPRYDIARTASKALKRRKTLDATGVLIINGAGVVRVTMNGRRYTLTVEVTD
jgi:hypothetical protein